MVRGSQSVYTPKIPCGKRYPNWNREPDLIFHIQLLLLNYTIEDFSDIYIVQRYPRSFSAAAEVELNIRRLAMNQTDIDYYGHKVFRDGADRIVSLIDRDGLKNIRILERKNEFGLPSVLDSDTADYLFYIPLNTYEEGRVYDDNCNPPGPRDWKRSSWYSQRRYDEGRVSLALEVRKSDPERIATMRRWLTDYYLCYSRGPSNKPHKTTENT